MQIIEWDVFLNIARTMCIFSGKILIKIVILWGMILDASGWGKFLIDCHKHLNSPY